MHCVGMCGPLALSVPINKHNTRTAIWGTLSYNLGRLTTYTYLGFLIGLLGFSASRIYAIQFFSILTGLTFIGTVFWGSLETWGPLRNITGRIGMLLSRWFPMVKKLPRNIQPYIFGVFNGFLPCGMVYLALLYTAASPNLGQSLLSMFSFGLGTFPVLFFIPLIGIKRSAILRKPVLQKSLLFMTGFLLILRGMNLGIPFLSPKLNLSPTNNQPQVVCCDGQYR